MAYRYNIDASGGAFTALTINNDCTPGERSLTIYAGPANNKWEEIIEDAAPDNDKLRLTASTNSSSSSRSGYGKIMYKINGNTCEAILHVVQAGSGGEVESHRIYIDVSSLVSGFSNYKLFLCDTEPDTSLHAVSLLKEDGDYFATNSSVVNGKVDLAELEVEKNGTTCTYLSDGMSTGEVWLNEWTGSEYGQVNVPRNTTVYVVLVPDNYDETSHPSYKVCTATTLNTNNVTCGDYTITAGNCESKS